MAFCPGIGSSLNVSQKNKMDAPMSDWFGNVTYSLDASAHAIKVRPSCLSLYLATNLTAPTEVPIRHTGIACTLLQSQSLPA